MRPPAGAVPTELDCFSGTALYFHCQEVTLAGCSRELLGTCPSSWATPSESPSPTKQGLQGGPRSRTSRAMLSDLVGDVALKQLGVSGPAIHSDQHSAQTEK